MRSITLITTGGTIEKTYDEQTGSLDNRRSIVRRMLRRIRLEDTSVSIIELMSKDSLLMTDEDRARISGLPGRSAPAWSFCMAPTRSASPANCFTRHCGPLCPLCSPERCDRSR
jgi:hypothetical protein